jgi:hypothetical protein
LESPARAAICPNRQNAAINKNRFAVSATFELSDKAVNPA